MKYCALVGFVLVAIAHCPRSYAESNLSSGSSSVIRVALFADSGASRTGSPHLWRCLPPEMKFHVSKVSAEDIRNGTLDEYEVLIHPGGSGSKQAETLDQLGREKVGEFVRGGGGFVGICAGAYLASSNYPWSLNLLDARVVDSAHWDRGFGDVQLRLPRPGRQLFGEDAKIIAAYYHQGPLLAPGEKEDLADYETLAAYHTEIAKNGAPHGVMKGTTAIARGTFGAGRVLCFSPHLEKTPGRDSFIRAAVRWAATSNASTVSSAAAVGNASNSK
jgi:glutamine amidotransferase-like uncharacterized protein